MFSQLSGTVGPETAKSLQSAVAHTHQSANGGLALVLGGLGVLLASAALTTQLQNAFNIIFGVVPASGGGIKKTIYRTLYVKAKNILVIVVGGLVVAASVLASTLISGLGSKVQDQFGLPAFTLQIVNNLASLLIFTCLLYLIYKLIPDLKVPHRVVLMASLVVALLFIFGKILLGIIIGNNGTASAYGAAASLVTLLLWIYYSAEILFLGAEGIKVYAQHHGMLLDTKKFNVKQQSVEINTGGYKSKWLQAFSNGYKKTKVKK